jgi:hypothetical protein
MTAHGRTATVSGRSKFMKVEASGVAVETAIALRAAEYRGGVSSYFFIARPLGDRLDLEYIDTSLSPPARCKIGVPIKR